MKRLPILQLSDGTRVFSSNAAARLLYGIDRKASRTVDFWLEWDSINLQPVLFHFNPEKPCDSKLFQLFEQLAKALEEHTYLVDVSVRW